MNAVRRIEREQSPPSLLVKSGPIPGLPTTIRRNGRRERATVAPRAGSAAPVAAHPSRQRRAPCIRSTAYRSITLSGCEASPPRPGKSPTGIVEQPASCAAWKPVASVTSGAKDSASPLDQQELFALASRSARVGAAPCATCALRKSCPRGLNILRRFLCTTSVSVASDHAKFQPHRHL